MMHTDENKMWVIGITGGVGSGKSEILRYLKEHYPCRVLLADEIAKEMQKKGGACYDSLKQLLGDQYIKSDGEFDRQLIADRIFHDSVILKEVNNIIHPAVTQEVLSQIEAEQKKGENAFFFIEAALLIESGFGKICDEIWYIYASEKVRRKRLIESRGYSEEKIDSMMGKQLGEKEFRKVCKIVIDNNGLLQESVQQINRVLEGYTWQRKRKIQKK